MISELNKKQFNKDILKLFNCINNINKINDSRFLDISSILNVLTLAYKGIDKKSKKKIKSDINLKELLKYNMPISINHRSGVFINNKYKFSQCYLKENNNNNVLSSIPMNEADKENINKKISEKFPSWNNPNEKNFFKHHSFNDITLYIKDQSYFTGEWEYKFSENTIAHEFFTGEYDKITIPMMIGRNFDLYSYESEKLNSIFIQMNYKEIDYSMLVIMPHNPHCKYKLIKFCKNNLTAEDIKEFDRNKKLVKYNEVKFPKFELKSEWDLNSNINFDKYCSYLKDFFDNEKINYRNISHSLYDFEMVNFVFTSTISFTNNNNNNNNNEESNFIFEKDFHNNQNNKLIIDKSFIFIIMNKEFMISKIGIFVG